MALTATQIAALSEGLAVAKLAIEVDATSPLRYCSGQNPVQVGGDWYAPRWVDGSVFELTSPQNAKAQVRIDDRDKVLETAWYSDRFSGYDVTINVLLRTPPEKAWTLATSVVWQCEKAEPVRGVMNIRLHAAGGHRQRWGLVIGNTSRFPWAPTADTRFTFGANVVTVREPIVDAPGRTPPVDDPPPAGGDMIRRPSGHRTPTGLADSGGGGRSGSGRVTPVEGRMNGRIAAPSAN